MFIVRYEYALYLKLFYSEFYSLKLQILNKHYWEENEIYYIFMYCHIYEWLKITGELGKIWGNMYIAPFVIK